MGEWKYSFTEWRRMVSFTLLPLYALEKNPRHPLYRRLGGPERRSGHCGEERNLLYMLGIEPPPSSA
jgi:hypothetical protein